MTDIVREYGLLKSTVTSIIYKKEQYKSATVAKGVSILTPTKRDKFVEEMESLLVLWIGDKQRKRDSVSEAMVYERARQLYSDLRCKAKGSASVSGASDSGAIESWNGLICFTLISMGNGVST